MAHTVGALRKHSECPLGVCGQCGKERYIVKKGEDGGQCSTCYSAARKQRMVGECPGCHRAGVPLASRGLCLRCSKRTRGDFRTAPDARRRDFTPAETQAARDRAEDFTEHLLPAVTAFAKRRLRRWEPWQREDALAEILGLAWVEFTRMIRRGRDPLAAPHWLARMVFESYAQGCRVTGDESGRDVMSDRVRWSGRTNCRSLSAPGVEGSVAVDGYLHAGCRSPIPKRVALRLDYNAWQRTLKPRYQVALDSYAEGYSTREVASRVSMRMDSLNKIRASLAAEWQRYNAEPAQRPR
jgi:hypothetical protein